MSNANCCTYSKLPPLPANLTAERIYTTKEAGEYLKVQPRTILSFITGDRPNKLRAAWIGRQWLVKESALRDFLTENERSESQIR
jgi:excisionase family DNA binding protein